MTKTVYITTAGDYFDYHIDRVFSTREKAQAWIDKIRANPPDEYRWNLPDAIHEFEVDEAAELCPRAAWWAEICLATGKIKAGRFRTKIVAGMHERGASAVSSGGNYASTYSFESHEHAEKLAVEARQKWLREKDQA